MSYVYSITRYIEKTYKKDMIHGSRENIMFPNLRLVRFLKKKIYAQGYIYLLKTTVKTVICSRLLQIKIVSY